MCTALSLPSQYPGTNISFGSEPVSDCVAVKSYPLDSGYIVGYALPKYEKAEGNFLWGWQDASSEASEIKPLDELFDAAVSGAQIRPVWKDEPMKVVAVGEIEIVGVILISVGFVAGFTVLLVTIFGKKPNNDPNSVRREENKRSRSKYHK